MKCGETLRAGKTCGRPAHHTGQHRTARAINRRNVRKRLDTERNAMLRDLTGGKDGRKTRTKKGDDYAREYRELGVSDDDYYAQKRAAGLIT